MTKEEMLEFVNEQTEIFPDDCEMGKFLRTVLPMIKKLDKIEQLAEEFSLKEMIAMGVSDEFENNLFMVL